MEYNPWGTLHVFLKQNSYHGALDFEKQMNKNSN